ncbi:MAG: GTPase HflX, partial [FCB group bacterium]|nr:GTPase HflX [FCB group bacterium]
WAVQNRPKFDPATYIGKGKIETVISQALELECSLIIINDEITPTQIKNIQKLAGEDIKVLDRTGLILDIFNKHARTREAKTQVELARLQYLLPRLTRMWTHLERQMGGVGTRGGPGETQIEIDRRLIQNQISRLKKDLKTIEKQRETQSHNRKDEFRAALVGYTNAGKSTLMNALTGADVYIQDQLFATLDTTVRKVELDSGDHFLLSDTVGFIRKLPHDLVASFRSTLKEAGDSDLLIKVLDASSHQLDVHMATIDNVLKQLDLDNIPSLVVLNKIDLVVDPAVVNGLRQQFPDAILISAARKLKLDQFTDSVLNFMKRDFENTTLSIPYEKGALLKDVYELMTVLDRKDTDASSEIQVEGRTRDIEAIRSRLND